ncbi:MAG: tRNA (guanosine(37)-N1)-methyltransferase TrmD [Chloroflexi bacterium]|nr:tRNA (guanosine(37)-N1)-methyltransferase TrmD [Chloroflexota bacterium]
MRFDVLTLFPTMFAGPLNESILKRAQHAGHVQMHIHDIRAYATDRHQTCDDTPYGGGAGMVMKIAPLAAAIRDVTAQDSVQPHVVYVTPDGEPLHQAMAVQLAQRPRVMILCGHYEGIDERVRTTFVHQEISIGDYVLTGGELAAMVIMDAVARLIGGVINADSLAEESHSDGLLEYPHYTRPAVWEGQAVPEVLASGHHGAIATWRRQQRLLRTAQRRPDMLKRISLSATDRKFLSEHKLLE